MKKVFILTLLLVALSFAEGGLSSSSSANSATSSSSSEQMGVEDCNSSGGAGAIPPGSCHINGFVCNLGYDLGEKSVLFTGRKYSNALFILFGCKIFLD